MAAVMLEDVLARLRHHRPSGYARRSEIANVLEIVNIRRDVAEDLLGRAPIPQEGLVPYTDFFQWLAQLDLTSSTSAPTPEMPRGSLASSMALLQAQDPKEDGEDWQAHLQRARTSVLGKPYEKLQNWTFSEWLNSLKIHEAIASALSIYFTDDSPEVQVSFLKKLGQSGSCKDVEKLLLDGHMLNVLATVILKGAQDLESAKAASGEHLNDKFHQEGSTFGLSYGSISTFFAGLEGLVGSPDRQIEAAMRREHCDSADSAKEFKTSNYDMVTTSRAEWYFVKCPQDGPQQVGLRELQLGGWPTETRLPDGKAEYCRKARPLTDFSQELRKLNAILNQAGEPSVMDDEVCGLRLYTGPMFMKYNGVLRAFANEFMKSRCEVLCLGNTYATTLHVINSGIVKSGKAMKATTVYRGIQGGLLPEGFWKPNEFNVRGGVEFAFMSTTLDRSVAMDYASGGAVGTIFEIKMGMIDRGADLSWISQYPHEKEICFAPLTGLEVVSTRVEGSVLVVQVRLNINLAALTIEQVLEKRKKVITDMCANLAVELSRDLRSSDWQDLADEVQCVQLPQLVKDVVNEQLTAIKDRPPVDFNDDETLQTSIQAALTVVAKARERRAEILEAVADRIPKEDAKSIREVAAALLGEEAVTEDVIVTGSAPLGMLSSLKGSVLEVLGLKVKGSDLVPAPVQKYEDTQGQTCDSLLAQCTQTRQDQLSLGWRLMKVNGQTGSLVEKLNDIYGDGKDGQNVELTFIRPMTPLEVKVVIGQMFHMGPPGEKVGIDGVQRSVRRLRRVLELNAHITTFDLRKFGLNQEAGLGIAKALETNCCISQVYLDDNNLGPQSGLAFAKAFETNCTLKTLSLDRTYLGERGGLVLAKALEMNSSVDRLCLNQNDFGEEAGLAFAKALETNSSIKELSLNENALGENAGLALATALRTNSVLNRLDLDDNALGKKAGLAFAAVLEKNSSVNKLSLDSNALGEEAGLAFAKALETNSSMSSLSLGDDGLGARAGVALAKALEMNSFLKELFLNGNALGDTAGMAFATALETNSSLNWLSLDDTGMGENAGLAFAKVLEMSNSVNVLSLEDNSLGENSGVALAKALEMNSAIVELRLCRNDLGENVGLAFAEVLENSSVKVLYLDENDLGENAGIALAKALEKNPLVKVLSLEDNNLGDNAGLSFAKALETNSSVSKLWLCNNDLGKKAGLALAKALKTNSSLKELYLDDNALGEKAGVAIANALETNSSVNKLSIDDNSLGDKAGLAFAKALKINTSVTELSLKNNGLGEDACEALEEVRWRSNLCSQDHRLQWMEIEYDDD